MRHLAAGAPQRQLFSNRQPNRHNTHIRRAQTLSSASPVVDALSSREDAGSSGQNLVNQSSIPFTAPLPKHVAVIADGNARWAQQRGLPVAVGHQAGVEALKATVKLCRQWGIQALTVYGFSTENWRRSEQEVEALMTLFDSALRDICSTAAEQGIRLHIIGDRSRLPHFLATTIDRVVVATQHCTALHLTIALSYSGRQDLVAAAQQLVQLAAQGELEPHQVDERTIQQLLGSREVVGAVGEPDLLIRTSGEQRLSNFMLWELAYAELFFAPCMWPDFDEHAFRAALVSYAARSRRYGSR